MFQPLSSTLASRQREWIVSFTLYSLVCLRAKCIGCPHTASCCVNKIYFSILQSHITLFFFWQSFVPPTSLKSNFCLFLPSYLRSSCFAGMALDIKAATICHSINTCEFNSAHALIGNTREATAASGRQREIKPFCFDSSFKFPAGVPNH